MTTDISGDIAAACFGLHGSPNLIVNKPEGEQMNSSTLLYYIKNQQDATLAVLFISNCKITLHVSDAFCVHHQEY